MPVNLRKAQRRALTFSRSLVNAIKSRISNTLFNDNHINCLPYYNNYRPSLPVNPHNISKPRHLQRVRPPTFRHPCSHSIQRLPAEILALVFILGSEDDVMFPMITSQVCGTWRQIALQTPSLWRKISLSPNEHLWLERISRAKFCSLDIQLLPHKKTRSGLLRRQHLDAYVVQWYMHIVYPYISRWRSLTIKFDEPAPYLLHAAMSNCSSASGRSQAPLLEELTLIHRTNDDPKEYRIFAGKAPRLRSVTLDGVRLEWLPSLFGNLTFLDYTHHGFTNGFEAVRDVISMLTVSTQLTDLRLTFPRRSTICSVSRMNAPIRNIVLPSLRHLSFRVEGFDIPFELARTVALLSTPSLISLSLVDSSRGHHSFPSLKSFFYICELPPSLRVLQIEYGWYDQRMLSPAIHALPHLRQVVIRRPHTRDQVLNINISSRRKPQRMLTHGHLHTRLPNIRP